MSNKSRRFPFSRALSQLLRTLLPAAALAFSTNVASAQDDGRVAEGSRVRISVPGSKKVTGIVKSRTADSTTIFVEGYAGTQRYLNTDITGLQISRGKSMMAGARKGVIWGGGFGAVLALAVLATPEDEYYADPVYSNRVIATQTFLGSLLWGAGIGALVRSEQWDTIPVRPRFAVSPSSGSVGVSVAFSPSFLH
ncbi:MAG TPA: hypothetical protein VM053_05530 [Gemmatimonadaceae bacterium]|nr:hypothetical protein [Gemmatimonadaceae bacterium]